MEHRFLSPIASFLLILLAALSLYGVVLYHGPFALVVWMHVLALLVSSSGPSRSPQLA